MTRKNPHISPAITDVPLRQTLQSIVDNASANAVITGNGPPSNSSASEGTVYHDAATNNLFIFSEGAYRPVQPKVNGSVTHDVGTIDVSELTSSEVAYYWDKALQENTGGYQNPSDGEVFILTSNHATGSQVYVFNGPGGVITLADDESTQVDVNSWYRQAAYIPGNLIVSRSLRADSVETNFINAFSINAQLIDAGTMNAARLQLTGNAEFSQGGGISFNKPTAASENNGLFFGSTSSQSGSDDFTFYASNEGTGSNSDKRSIRISKDELTLVNPTIKVGNAGAEANLYITNSTSNTERLFNRDNYNNKTIKNNGNVDNNNYQWNVNGDTAWGGYEVLKIALIGGGGGGGARWDYGNNGTAGNPTTVTIKWVAGGSDTVLTAAGGAGGAKASSVSAPPSAGTDGEDGKLIPHGGNSNGGAGGQPTFGAGTDGSGNGSGGGGAGGKNSAWNQSSVKAGNGGKAGAITTFEVQASLVDELELSIGAGGSGGGNGNTTGDGAQGAVKLWGADTTLDTINLDNIDNPPYNGIGTYVFARATVAKAGGQTRAGSNLKASDNAETQGSSLSGNWKCMGEGTGTYTTLWARYD